ncbi:MAG: PilZ domain-containing protein [Acidobacteriota bacterium]|nr:PilZ domain-containing protein [Acidobacteriota bacterium]
MEERRLEGRFLCADLVRLTVHDLGCREMEAVLEDISQTGGCVQVDEEVPLGASVHLTIGDNHIFAGQVRYCNFRDCGYYVGIEFDRQSAWSEQEVVPRHLTNLEVLVRKAAG